MLQSQLASGSTVARPSTLHQTRQLHCPRSTLSQCSRQLPIWRLQAAENASSSSVAAAQPPEQPSADRTIIVHFREEDVSAPAAAGEDLIEVAQRCGVVIPTGCWQGNCGVCEVEVYKYTGDAEKDKGAAAAPAVVRACITKLPPGYSRIEVAQMQDAIWGLDGFDT